MDTDLPTENTLYTDEEEVKHVERIKYKKRKRTEDLVNRLESTVQDIQKWSKITASLQEGKKVCKKCGLFF